MFCRNFCEMRHLKCYLSDFVIMYMPFNFK